MTKLSKILFVVVLALSRSRAAYIHQHFSIRSMQDTSICSVSCLPLFLTLLFQNSAICGVSASLLSKTGLLVAFLCAPTKDAPTGQLGMCRLGWLLRAVVPSVTSQIFQILSGWFWYKKNLATPGKECGSGLFIPIEILQLGRFFALSGGDQQLKFDSTEQCGACHIRFH